MSNRIITISREFGSGGRTIGKKVAEALNIPCYDKDIIDTLTESTSFSEDFVKENSEYIHSGWFSGFTMGLVTPTDQIWIAQARLIQDLAKKGSCVFVGRCADYILHGEQNTLRVFIHADYDFRSRRINEVYGENEVPTIQRLKEKDKSRRAYYLHYTDTEWGQLQNYDVVLNSGVLGIDKCVSTIVSLY